MKRNNDWLIVAGVFAAVALSCATPIEKPEPQTNPKPPPSSPSGRQAGAAMKPFRMGGGSVKVSGTGVMTSDVKSVMKIDFSALVKFLEDMANRLGKIQIIQISEAIKKVISVSQSTSITQISQLLNHIEKKLTVVINSSSAFDPRKFKALEQMLKQIMNVILLLPHKDDFRDILKVQITKLMQEIQIRLGKMENNIVEKEKTIIVNNIKHIDQRLTKIEQLLIKGSPAAAPDMKKLYEWFENLKKLIEKILAGGGGGGKGCEECVKIAQKILVVTKSTNTNIVNLINDLPTYYHVLLKGFQSLLHSMSVVVKIAGTASINVTSDVDALKKAESTIASAQHQLQQRLMLMEQVKPPDV